MRIKGLPERPIENITVENVSVNAENGLSCSDAKGVRLHGVHIRAKKDPVMLFKDSEDVIVEKSSCGVGTGTFLKIEGGKTKNIRLGENDLSNAQNDVGVGEEVPADALVRTSREGM